MKNQLFVGNLSFSTTAEELKTLFSKFGEVTEVKLPVDRETGRARGFGFVTFESADDAKEALELNGTTVNGRDIRVNIAEEKKSTGGAGGSRGGFGGGSSYGGGSSSNGGSRGGNGGGAGGSRGGSRSGGY